MTPLTTHAAWVLVVTFTISLVYEIWRATLLLYEVQGWTLQR